MGHGVIKKALQDDRTSQWQSWIWNLSLLALSFWLVTSCCYCNFFFFFLEFGGLNTDILLYSAENPKSEMDLAGLRSMCGQGCVPFKALIDNPFPFQLLEATCVSWLMVPFRYLHSRQRHCQAESFLCCHFSGFLFLSSLPLLRILLLILGPHI